MKRNIFLIMLCVLFHTCKEEVRPEIIMDTVPPGPVTGVEVRNTPGGAVLKYQLPDDEDLLYVKAVYSLKEGHQAEVRASLYNDSLVLNGFGSTDRREVKVVAVDRSKNESNPETVFVEPLEPPVHTIGKTLSIEPTFGGLYASWKNPDRAEISVTLEKKDEYGDYVIVDVFYSSVVDGSGTSRGMDTITGDFRVYVQDRWENQSAPLDTTLTPMFEMKFDRMKFQALYLAGDEPYAWGWVLPNLFDGSTDEPGFHTSDQSSNCPQVISFDMGVKGKISRIKIWQRGGGWIYAHANFRRFEIWGTNNDANFNDWSVWTKLAECESIKPSGLPLGLVNDEDRAWAAAGEEFPFPIDAPACRYLRMVVYENWSGTCYFHVMEIEVYGSEEN